MRIHSVLGAVLCGVVAAGCAVTHGVVEEQNRALVNRFGEAVNARDFDAVRRLLAPGFIRHSQASPNVSVEDADQFVAYLKADAAVFPDGRQTLEHVAADGDLVAFWVRYEGTQEAAMGPFPPSRRRMRLDTSGFFRVRDGKLAELWVTWDNLTALTQLGHFPPPANH